MRTLKPVTQMAWLVLGLSLPAMAGGQERPSSIPLPEIVLGDFVDDYGIRYSISPGLWSQGSEMRHEILEWDVQGQRLIARNAASNPTDAGLWTRVDWVVLDPGGEYQWAFCYAVYDATTAESAMAAPETARATPRTGCNGFPFSRMKRVRE